MESVRVRFAPSPTGTLHIGGARTALFNWLFARSNKGTFVLRIEDTDLNRSTEDSALGIIDGLRWLGLNWDEGPDIGGIYGPYRQSERMNLYHEYLQKLLKADKAYYCFCSSEELQRERDRAREERTDYKYKGTCGALSPAEIAKRIQQGQKPVIRLRVSTLGKTIVHDLIRGDVEFHNNLLDDFIICKSDGWPTYNFAVVVDDYSMSISHVIRAEEHLSNTPKQLLIYEALGLNLPQFAHVSMILAPDRSKLSKRHGATSVQEFRDEGYLPEALVNYLALLGWSPGDDIDLMKIDEIIRRFDLENISKSAAVYDVSKLTWMNGHYLAEADITRILDMVEKNAVARGWLNKTGQEYFYQVIKLVRGRGKTVNEIIDSAEYFFKEPHAYDEKGVKKYFKNINSVAILQTANDIVKRSDRLITEELEQNFRQEAESMGLKAAELIHPTRLALSGRTATPGLFEVMELLGSEQCIGRIDKAIGYIEGLNLPAD